MLLAGLRANRLAASGLVDGGERRPLTGEEWHDFLIEVLSDQKAFQSIFPIRGLKPGSYFVAVRSLGMIPGEAVRLRIGRAMGELAGNSSGEPMPRLKLSTAFGPLRKRRALSLSTARTPFRSAWSPHWPIR